MCISVGGVSIPSHEMTGISPFSVQSFSLLPKVSTLTMAFVCVQLYACAHRGLEAPCPNASCTQERFQVPTGMCLVSRISILSKEDVVCIYTVEYYSAIKKYEIMPFAATWMDQEIIILSEVSQTKTNTI